MKTSKKILTIAFAMFLLMTGAVYEASAQTRRVVVRRPVVVRTYVYRDPFVRSRYYYDPFYSSYYSPYLAYQDQRIRLEQDLAGNRRELNEHLRKYRADGVITAKEQRELDDDYKDVRNSTLRLRSFTRNY